MTFILLIKAYFFVILSGMDKQSCEIIENLLNKTASWAHGKPLVPIHIEPVVETIVENPAVKESIETQIEMPKPKSKCSIQSIAEKAKDCTRCELHKNRKNIVTGMGVENPLVLVIGEAPGQEEDVKGLPFVGPAGQLLDKMLGAIQLSRNTNCYIANIVKCRPPYNRDPMPAEMEACSSYLHAQIACLKPKMILAVGRVAAQFLLNTPTGISRLHGQILEYNPIQGATEQRIPFMATYHPSALLRDPSYKKPAWDDLKKFKIKLEEICPNYESSVITTR